MQIYLGEIQAFMALDGADLITKTRRERVGAYTRAEDKARCLVAGLLLRRVCGVTDDGQLAFGPNGKPYLKYGGPHFNLSHSGGYAALAVSDNEVGVDIETIAPVSDAVAARCFTPPEREWMQRQESGPEAFFRLWTAKESIMKALGLGLSLPPASFSVLPADAPAYSVAGRNWFLDWRVHDGHMICRAVENAAETTEIVVLSAGELCRGGSMRHGFPAIFAGRFKT
jgi:4'-phosphopantetheinyl transferase